MVLLLVCYGQVLTGVELLLSKAQDWEPYAHRLASMASELEPLSHLVTRWRKKELSSWRRLLDLKVGCAFDCRHCCGWVARWARWAR